MCCLPMQRPSDGYVGGDGGRLPVVASRVGGVPSVVVDGVHGILVEPGNVAELTEALLRLLRDPALRARMGEAGRLRIVEQYVPEQIIPQIEALYCQVLGRDKT